MQALHRGLQNHKSALLVVLRQFCSSWYLHLFSGILLRRTICSISCPCVLGLLESAIKVGLLHIFKERSGMFIILFLNWWNPKFTRSLFKSKSPASSHWPMDNSSKVSPQYPVKHPMSWVTLREPPIWSMIWAQKGGSAHWSYYVDLYMRLWIRRGYW